MNPQIPQNLQPKLSCDQCHAITPHRYAHSVQVSAWHTCIISAFYQVFECDRCQRKRVFGVTENGFNLRGPIVEPYRGFEQPRIGLDPHEGGGVEIGEGDSMKCGDCEKEKEGAISQTQKELTEKGWSWFCPECMGRKVFDRPTDFLHSSNKRKPAAE